MSVMNSPSASRRPHETSTDYRHPYRPGLLRAANTLFASLPERGPHRASLEPDHLLTLAQRRALRAGCSAPAPDAELSEALLRLTRSIEEEAKLHTIGRFITRGRLISTLTTKFRLDDLSARDPSLARLSIRRPIVIVGLPRTGTTLLHRLLASDTTRIRAVKSWEALMPLPDNREIDTSRRVAAADRAQRALKFMAPDFFAVHPIDARGPEEEILLLDLALRSTVPEATMYVPSYSRWLEDADQSPAYRTMALALNALSRQRAPSAESWRWVLKTPHHLEWIDELPKVFEDPLIVWTHRAPKEVVGSFCSMIAHGRGVFSDTVDPLEIGSSWLRKGKRMVERAMEARERLGKDSFIDIRYRDLIGDPVAAVRAIEERAGLSWSAETEARVRANLQQETKDRHGVHRYSLDAFGLTEKAVDDGFRDYRKAFLA